MISCPHCKGRGGGPCFINRGEDYRTHSIEHRACRTCNGFGEVTAEHAERIAEGRALRDGRLSRGVSLMDEAARLGISPARLSAIERGNA